MGDGLFRYDTNGAVLHLTTKNGLPSDFVRCVIEDREGNIWAGTEGGGLCRLKPVTFESFGMRQGLSSDLVMAMVEAREGELWIGLNGDGLNQVTGNHVERFGVEQGLKNGHVWSVVQDRAGVIWAGTWDGLFRWEQDRFVGQTDGTNIGWQVLSLYEDSKGALWLGQQAFGALTRVYGNERTVIKIPGASSGLDVRVIVEDREGDFWIGTNDDGLYRMRNGQFTRFGRKDGLHSEAIWSLKIDADDGSLWIGTCRGGLSRLHQGRLTTWTTKEGMINNVICQILEDQRGNLWLGSHGGVFRVGKDELNDYAAGQKATIQCVGYGKAEGLPSLECQGGFQPSGCKTRDGRLWFPTAKGLAVVNPETIVRNPLPPLVVIEELLVDGKVQTPKHETVSVAIGTVAKTAQISPGKQRVDFRYTGLSLAAPESVRFRYRLAPLEQDWIEAGTARTANYSHVPPGNYRFQVVACNNDGVWNETGDTVAIAVLPYFWQTKFFLVMVALVSLGIVAGIVRRIEARKLQRQLEIAERERAIESERTRIAKDIHDDLGASLTEIAILSDLAGNPAAPREQAGADVRKIAVKARELTRSLDEIVWAVNPQYDSLDSLVTYSCDFAQNYLQLAGVVCRLEIPTRLPEVQLTADVRHNLLMTLKEALNNTVKHAGASEVQIKVALEPDLFVLKISDNGKGFRMEGLPVVADAVAAPATSRGLGGNGLLNMQQRIESIGGEFELKSQPGQGTQVMLTGHLKHP
jgi:signal transduction histidine kinase/streptogramin lyase